VAEIFCFDALDRGGNNMTKTYDALAPMREMAEPRLTRGYVLIKSGKRISSALYRSRQDAERALAAVDFASRANSRIASGAAIWIEWPES
jgi:hypothetical protein